MMLHEHQFDEYYVPTTDFYKNKNVLDIASHVGITSACISNFGASTVIGIEPRAESVEQAQNLIKQLKLNNVSFIVGDATDYKMLDKLLENIDTVFCAGVFYHLNDHFNLLKHICVSSAQYLLLETLYGLESSNPTMICTVESTNDLKGGINEGFDQVMVGIPNIVWIKQVLDIFNWQIVFFKTKQTPQNYQGLERMIIGAVNMKYIDTKNYPTLPEDYWQWKYPTEKRFFSAYKE